MRVFVQPEDGVMPVIKAIQRARKSIDILIFRFDRGDVEKALLTAVGRGVAVRALIAYTNRGGEKHLRDLEMRLLAAGVTVARTADDLARYHGKMLIVDRTELIVLTFNFTSLDIEHSRSFGATTRNPALVREAVKLFDSRLPSSDVFGRVAEFYRQSSQCEARTRSIHPEGEEGVADLRSARGRSRDDPLVGRTGQGRRLRSHHRTVDAQESRSECS